MTVYIEFPMIVLKEYEGEDNVYQILDDHITDLVRKPFQEKDIPVKITRLDFVDPVPNKNDELVRYELQVEEDELGVTPKEILHTLEEAGYEKGLTIKDHHGESLYNDEYTADIPLRRKAQEK